MRYALATAKSPQWISCAPPSVGKQQFYVAAALADRGSGHRQRVGNRPAIRRIIIIIPIMAIVIVARAITPVGVEATLAIFYKRYIDPTVPLLHLCPWPSSEEALCGVMRCVWKYMSR